MSTTEALGAQHGQQEEKTWTKKQQQQRQQPQEREQEKQRKNKKKNNNNNNNNNGYKKHGQRKRVGGLQTLDSNNNDTMYMAHRNRKSNSANDCEQHGRETMDNRKNKNSNNNNTNTNTNNNNFNGDEIANAEIYKKTVMMDNLYGFYTNSASFGMGLRKDIKIDDIRDDCILFDRYKRALFDCIQFHAYKILAYLFFELTNNDNKGILINKLLLTTHGGDKNSLLIEILLGFSDIDKDERKVKARESTLYVLLSAMYEFLSYEDLISVFTYRNAQEVDIIDILRERHEKNCRFLKILQHCIPGMCYAFSWHKI